jgi:hypothetical protein
MSGVGRREFVALLGGAAAWPVTFWRSSTVTSTAARASDFAYRRRSRSG